MPQPGSADQIFIVDDDAAVRETLSLVFTSAGYDVVRFAEGAALLAAVKVRSPVCIILDVHIPGKSGLDILKQLNAEHSPVPIFIMSGRGDIAMAVEAIKNGALDFIEKPFRGSEVVTRVRGAIEANAQRMTSRNAAPMNFPGLEPLTPREQDVLGCLMEGASNKEMARQLGISPRTIEVHRARIMEKLGAKNTADLIRVVMSEGRKR
jgi:two-component system, LuxR family, response regulator FixJ